MKRLIPETMQDHSVQNLLALLDRHYSDRVKPYGSSGEEEHGLGFTIDGIPATFSAITLDASLPLNRYDVQVESVSPGEYLYTAQISLEEFHILIELFAGPADQWPSNA